MVANNLFGREKYGPWKHHQPKAVSDSNTLPARSNTRCVESYMEAMALHSIAEEVMNGEDTCVVWSNDGSSQSGVGVYVVQSLIINGTTFIVFALTLASNNIPTVLKKPPRYVSSSAFAINKDSQRQCKK